MSMVSGAAAGEFWSGLQRFANQPCLVDGETGKAISYGDLAASADELGERFYGRQKSGLVFLEGRTDIGSVVHLTAALRAGQAVHLYSPSLPADRLEHLRTLYRPDFTVSKADRDFPWGYRVDGEHRAPPVHPDLAMLFSTSGSTGSSKMVRLSHRNLAASATQVIQALRITSEIRSFLNLPLSYIYGFSVLNSQLASGGCVVLDRRSFIDRRVWPDLAARGVGELHGVPASYELIQRAMENGLNLPPLKRFTQSGGAPSRPTLNWMREVSNSRKIDIFKMYGMTEASSRVTVLPPEEFSQRSSSVGLAVADGALSISSAGEIVYQGPNVMLGYGFSRPDLATGDVLQGCLETGDIGHLDDRGFLYLEGRLDRTAKVLGLRINLDELERMLDVKGVAVVAFSGGVRVVASFGESELELRSQVRRVMLKVGIPANLVEIQQISELPRLGNGKVDYPRLAGA